MESSFTDIYLSIGNSVSSSGIEHARRCARRPNDLPELRRTQLLRNLILPPQSAKEQEPMNEKIELIDEQEIVQTVADPEDIDALNISRAYEGKICPYSKLIYMIGIETQERGRFLRTIPHFKRLSINTQRYLPRHIFRVVHSKSAGKVFVDDQGVTHFWSQAYTQHEGPSSFENFDMESITHQLKYHISGYKSDGKNPFTSHFISTTDSFERAINRAQRHHSRKDNENVVIYVIDTHSFRFSSLIFLMALALRAWNVLELIPQWKNAYFMHGALTEWIFWDAIVANKVEAIDYAAFCKPPPSDTRVRRKCLENIIPLVVEAGRYKASTDKGVSRSVLHASLYATKKQEKERADFALHTRASRNGPLPAAPHSVKNDRRAMINDAALADVWNIVSQLENRNLLFVWILSLLTEKYLFSSIVERIVRRYPQVVEESFELVTAQDGTSGGCESILVHYMSGRGCLGRVDVNGYQRMMLACARSWHHCVYTSVDHKYHGIEGYVVTGEARPPRNLIQAHEYGLRGGCRTETMQQCPSMTLVFKQIVKSGERLLPEETDEQHRLRLERETGNVCYGPDEIRSPTSRRVRYDDKSHLPTQQSG